VTEAPPSAALVICPVFASGTPPLSLASLQPPLRQAGVTPVPFDLDFMLLREDAATHQALFAAYNIGHADGLDTVQFVIRPRFMLAALFPEAFPAADLMLYEADLAVVRAIDARLGWWADRIIERGVGAVLCSVYVSNLLPTLLLARAVRARAPGLPIALGGPGVAAPAIQEFILRLGVVNACVTGEGERVVGPLTLALLRGSTLDAIPGVSWFDGEQRRDSPAAPLTPLADVLEAPPDFAGFPIPGYDVGAYRSNPAANLRWFGVALPVATTRGCVMRCTFCSESVYWKRFRSREPDAVIDEIASLIARWGVRQFVFGDSLLNGTPKWLVRFAERCIERDLGATFLFAYLRPTRLPRETLTLLYRAGFRVLGFGMETASQRLLDRLDKGTRVDEARQIYEDSLDVGLHVNISILTGIPGEVLDDVFDSVRFVQQLTATVTAKSGAAHALTVHAGSPLRVEPYSPMYAHPDDAGIRLIPGAPDLPPALAHLRAEPLFERWTGSVSADDLAARSEWVRAALDRAPMTVFQGEPYAFDDQTLARPLRPAMVLTGDAGVFLSDGTRILAQIDPFVAATWAAVTDGLRFGEARAQLAVAYPTIDVDARLREALNGLVVARLVWVDDFA
jgi:radical SAM superfamily enzyme YgiQ (UPF0313 family)